MNSSLFVGYLFIKEASLALAVCTGVLQSMVGELEIYKRRNCVALLTFVQELKILFGCTKF